MPHRFTIAALTALAALLTATPALAGSPASKPPPARVAPPKPAASHASPEATPRGATITRAQKVGRITKDDGYSYTFGDDPLQAQGNDPSGARIAVRKGHVRGLLIRPRIQFVDALLKSVENL